MPNKKEIENYINDARNIIDINSASLKQTLEDVTFFHKEMTLLEFIEKGIEMLNSCAKEKDNS